MANAHSSLSSALFSSHVWWIPFFSNRDFLWKGRLRIRTKDDILSSRCRFRVYRESSHTIVCHYEQPAALGGGNLTRNRVHSLLSANGKRNYLLMIVIFRVAVPFLLLLTANIILFVSVRKTRNQPLKSTSTLLTRHGHHRQVTPMIFFSSCILLLTISPR